MKRATAFSTLLAVLSCVGVSAVHANPRTNERSLFVVGGGIGARLPGAEDGYAKRLEDYGYDVGKGFMWRAHGFAAYRGFRQVDLGISAEYAYMHNAHPEGKTIAMRTHSRQLGVFARPRLAAGRYLDLGLRLGAGLMHASTTLRQETLTEISPFTRIQLELMIGNQQAGAVLHLGHVQQYQKKHYRPYAATDMDGVQFGFGVYYRLR